MHQKIAVVEQHPFGLFVAFQADWQLTNLVLEIEPHLVRYGLDLPLVGAGGDDEVVRERRDTPQIEHLDIGSFLGFGGADGYEPGRGSSCGGDGFVAICLGQNTLLSVSYYMERSAIGERSRDCGGSSARDVGSLTPQSGTTRRALQKRAAGAGRE